MFADAVDRILAVLGKLVRVLVYLALILPAVIVVATSFTSGDAMRFPPTGFSLRWYYAFWDSPLFIDSLILSLKVAALATVLSLLFGFAAAFGIERCDFRGRELMRGFMLSPLLIPAVVLGLGLMQLQVWIGLSQTFVGLLIGHVVVTLPYVVRTLSASMVLFDRNLEQAAMSLRATPATVLRTVTIPLLVPGIISAGVFAFVTSFGNVSLSVFLGAGGNVTLPVQVLAYVEQTVDPLVAAVSSVVIVFTLVAILIADRISGPKSVI
ncbi:ABC transporter permease [Bradyrhizobium sp. CCGUVB23]|uniref:ABC transporter permease n=1 Tax=Bradyrhizobium sp. CCGUVB23 TaxID=2949630 RepID=UPI0020B2EDE6|nr:ABC transporter permease [Bradyrhizobium sp. CCGUVB23]MCP3461032.1 ABC transporter permease [Bradyrhizobium sp. CCGUVB23]